MHRRVIGACLTIRYVVPLGLKNITEVPVTRSVALIECKFV
jgi:hypothetical protein